MSEKNENHSSGRRNFFRLLTVGGAGFVLSPIVASAPAEAAEKLPPVKPATNIQDALKFPRNSNSMPGLFPGVVTQVNHSGCIKDKVIQQKAVDQMLTAAMLNLTGKKSVKKAWRKFVSPDDIVGLKVNPVAGKLLTTSHELVKAVIAQLEMAGIPRKNIVIWDRREMELHETGFLYRGFWHLFHQHISVSIRRSTGNDRLRKSVLGPAVCRTLLHLCRQHHRNTHCPKRFAPPCQKAERAPASRRGTHFA